MGRLIEETCFATSVCPSITNGHFDIKGQTAPQREPKEEPFIKLLFICSRNKWRSLTAEKIFESLPQVDVRSAGTENGARIKVTGGHVGWADRIFVMEKKHMQRLKEKFADELRGKSLICLDIPDDYGYMDEELIELLKSRVSEHMEIPEAF